MKAQVWGACARLVNGRVEVRRVAVRVELLRRLPAMTVVGLSAMQVKETAERVRSAIEAQGFRMPRLRVVVEIEPEGEPFEYRRDRYVGLDLAIAQAILVADGLPNAFDPDTIFVGELSLAGYLRPVQGMQAVGLLTEHPVAGSQELWANGFRTRWALRELADVGRTLSAAVEASKRIPEPERDPAFRKDFAECRGFDASVYRSITDAVRNEQGLLFVSEAPGLGTTMLAYRIGGLLPQEFDVQRAALHDMAGMTCAHVPFRAPHHTVTASGMLGTFGARPGELDLARGGVLFLDELNLFSKTLQEIVARSEGFFLCAAVCEQFALPGWREKLAPELRERLSVEIRLTDVSPPRALGAPGPSTDELRRLVGVAP